ncbi:MAG: tetratricopeptide repeat protein [Planctomycetia bacterium]|nr:tetratricopeptide repeat protein [Planctomycetia bacterium]
MTRLILITVATLLALWILLNLGIVPEPLARLFEPLVGLACSLAIPALIITSYAAPGLLRDVADDARHLWHRVRTRRHDIDELEVKIAHLDRPYHMHQLGLIYAAQGRIAKARPWFERALAKDPDAVETKYHLACCDFAQKQYATAADLLEQVHAKRPDYDYGMAYLRLAQSQQLAGNLARAGEVYQTLLRFYPGHPEGTYYYALLKADDHAPDEARQLMRDVIFTVRHSPGFHRRRNRHWALKAQWWLWRHRRV